MIVGKKNSKKESNKTRIIKKVHVQKVNLETKNEFGDSFKSDPNIFQIAETT